MSNEQRDVLIKDIQNIPVRSMGGQPVDLSGPLAQHLIELGYRKLEPAWEPTLENDGVYEYTTSSSCDGTNATHWRRKPRLASHEKPQPWERTDEVSA